MIRGIDLILVPLLLTILFELLIYFLFFRKKFKFKEIALYVFLINLFTWPLANLFYPLMGFFVEIFVFIFEAILIFFLFEEKWHKSILISFIANFLTFILGFILPLIL